jgi:hypothetical protein
MRRRNCPYLGLQYDSSTCHAFPSEHNYCHKVNVPGPVDLDFQSSVCLTEDHIDCPIYNGVEEFLPAPEAAPVRRGLLRCGCIFTAIAIMSALVALAAPLLTGSSGVGTLFQLLGEPTPESFFTPTPLVLPTDLPAATATDLVEGCTSPIGWLPYTLQAGDDLVAIARQLGISLLDIQQANCNLDLLQLVAGDVIYLPLTGVMQASATSTPSATATLLPPSTQTDTPVPTETETPTPTITATFYYPPTPTSPPIPTPRPRRPTDTPAPQPTEPEDRPTSTPPPVRP